LHLHLRRRQIGIGIGGIGIGIVNTTPSAQAAFVKSVKSRRVPLLSSPIVFSPDSRSEKKESKLADCMIPADSSLLVPSSYDIDKLDSHLQQQQGRDFAVLAEEEGGILDVVSKESWRRRKEEFSQLQSRVYRFSVTVRFWTETGRLGSAKKPSKIGSVTGPMFDRISVSVNRKFGPVFDRTGPTASPTGDCLSFHPLGEIIHRHYQILSLS
ncbi:hypothetical protein LINPERHAP1_LOCUS13121, partial [Linum perenne]